MDSLLTIIFLICVCHLPLNIGTKWERPSCPARNPLKYAGRHTLNNGLLNNVTTPCGQRVFILRLPPRYSNHRTKFPFGPGKGKIWIRRGRCKAPEQNQDHCPSRQDNSEGVCGPGGEDSSSGTCGLTDKTTLTFYNVSSTTIGVDWSKFNFNGTIGPVSGYALEIRIEGQHSFTRINKNSTTHIFQDLRPDTVYEIRLVLTSCGLPGDGDILTSEISTNRTLCGDIGPVRNLTVTSSIKHGELDVSWEKPEKENNRCIVRTYQIEYILVKYIALSEIDAKSGAQPFRVNVQGYNTTLKNLEDYATYEVSVTPITSWSDVESNTSSYGNTTENIPSQVEDFSPKFVNLSVIQLTWSLSARPKGRIRDYTIVYGPINVVNATNGTETVNATRFDQTNTPVYILTGLQGETTYIIQIRARTDVGFGNWSRLNITTTDGFNYYEQATTVPGSESTTISTTQSTAPALLTTTGSTIVDETQIAVIVIVIAITLFSVSLVCVCLIIRTKRKLQVKEKEKLPAETGLANGPSPYQQLHKRAEDLTRYMKIGDFGPSTYMMYGQGDEDNKLYTGINVSQRNSSSLDVAEPSLDASGYAGLTQRPSDKDYTQLLPNKEGSTTENTNDENGNKNTLKDPNGYMGLQNRNRNSDYTKLLSNSKNGDTPAPTPTDVSGENGGVSTFQTPSPKPSDQPTESSKQDESNSNSVLNGITQGGVDSSENGSKQTVRREQYERNVIPDEMLLQVPYFEHIGSEEDRISYFEPIADEEEGNENPYNASVYGKTRASYETSLQVPLNPFLKRKMGKGRESESYESATGSYEKPLDEIGQPLKNPSALGKNGSQLKTILPQNDDEPNRTSKEYFEPIESDDHTSTTAKKDSIYTRSSREVYETIPDSLRNSQKKGSKYGRSNYSQSVNTAQSKKSKIPARLPYEKSLLGAELPLKNLSNRKHNSSAYEDAASGYGRLDTSGSRLADNSNYFISQTGTMKSNASREYFEPIADNEDHIDDPEVIRNRLENYEMIPEMKKHLRMTEKNSSKIYSTDGITSPVDKKGTRIPQRGEKSKRMAYETSFTHMEGDQKQIPSDKPAADRTNPANSRERWREALRKANAGYYHKSVDSKGNTDKTSGYTSRNYIEPIASDEEADTTYETTEHDRIDEQNSINGTHKQNLNEKKMQTQQSFTVDDEVTYEETKNDELLGETEPEGLYQAIPAYGSFQDSLTTESGVLGEIKIKNLPRQLWNGSSSPEITLTEEFQTLPRGQQHPWTDAKARDDDVDSGLLPYDHSRVKLQDISGDSKSDYYNGSYIKDQFNKINFIAAKVPKKATTENYWQMVWESKTELVVILASGKSYLPSEKDAKKSVGRLTLTWTSILENSKEFYIRQLEMKKGNAVQNVKICQHLVWHETCRLPSSSSVITFVRHVKSVRRKESVPIIVQCSNGVGATGVFIAVYSLLNHLKSNRGSPLSVHEFVRNMRQHRVDMVQSRSEYLLVYETLISIVLAPEKAVTVDLLMRMDLAERQDALEREFETLTKLNKLSLPRSTNAGAHESNVSKNRYPEVLPLDSYRVVLKSLEKSGNGSYINATLVNSAVSDTSFIMAQSPLPSTNDNFWRMIYQYECSSVISLNDTDSQNEIIGTYLPKIGQKRYGKIHVKCIGNPENSGGVLQQRLSLSHSSSKKKLEVNHFQLPSWPRDESQMAGFIRIMVKMQQVVKTKGTVTVHCLDGGSRCGVFVAIATEMGNLKNRGDIDVFQTVYELKGRCRHVITKFDDYFLCYRVIKGILDAREHDYETLPSDM